MKQSSTKKVCVNVDEFIEKAASDYATEHGCEKEDAAKKLGWYFRAFFETIDVGKERKLPAVGPKTSVLKRISETEFCVRPLRKRRAA